NNPRLAPRPRPRPDRPAHRRHHLPLPPTPPHHHPELSPGSEHLDWHDVEVRDYGDGVVTIGTQTQEAAYQGAPSNGGVPNCPHLRALRTAAVATSRFVRGVGRTNARRSFRRRRSGA